MWRTVALAVVSLAISLIALAVNASGLVRRPRIVAEWGDVQTHPPREGMSIIVTARRRPIEVDELGLVRLARATRRRQLPEWLTEDWPVRVPLNAHDLPRRLQDGESARAFADLDLVIDELRDAPGVIYPYVLGSGKVYLANDSTMLRKLRRRIGS